MAADHPQVARVAADDAERSVLGAALLDDAAAADIAAGLLADYADPRHRRIAAAIGELRRRGAPTDPIAVADALGDRLADAGGQAHLLDLLEGVVSAAGTDYHAEIVRTAAHRRRLAALGRDIAERADDGTDPAELVALARQRIDRLGARGAAQGLRLLALADVLAMSPQTWLIGGLVPAGGITVLGADSGTGKSLLALGWGLAIANGVRTWQGCAIGAHGPVLWLAGEGMRSLGPRTRAWAAAHPGEHRDDAPIHFAPLPDLSTAPGRAQVTATLAQMRPVLVVVDTLARAMAGGDENDAAAASTTMAMLRQWSESYGCAVVLLHHLSKDPTRSGTGRLRGSTAIAAEVDASLSLTKRDGVLTLAADKQRDGDGAAPPIRMRLLPVADSVVIVPATEGHAATDEADPVVELEARAEHAIATLRRMPGQRASREALAVAMGGRRTVARAAIDHAAGAGKAVRIGGTGSRTVLGLPDDAVPSGTHVLPPTPPGRDGTGRPGARPSRPNANGTARDGSGRDPAGEVAR